MRIPTRLFAMMFIFALAPSFLGAAPVIGTFDLSRATTANLTQGQYTNEAVASLKANFPGTKFVSAPTLTASFLADVDIVILGSPRTDTLPISPLSLGEQTALLNFVKAGGSAFLIAEGYSPFLSAAQSLVSPFGVTAADDGLGGPLVATPTTNSHPIINGPFGETAGIIVFGSGIFPDLGPYATSLADMDAKQESVLAVIESNALSPGSGRVVLYADSTPFIDGADGGLFSAYEPLFLNTVHYLATPEPSSLVLALAGIGAAALLAFTDRRRSSL